MNGIKLCLNVGVECVQIALAAHRSRILDNRDRIVVLGCHFEELERHFVVESDRAVHQVGNVRRAKREFTDAAECAVELVNTLR